MGLILAYKKSSAVPQVVQTPTIVGTVQIGSELQCTYELDKTNNAFVRWYSYTDPELTQGETLLATTANYTVQAGDANKYLVADVESSNNAGAISVRSARTSQVPDTASPAPSFSVGASISGTARVGNTLSVSYTVQDSTSESFQWYTHVDADAAGVEIASATTDEFIPTVDEVGLLLTCIVSATNASDTTTSTSAKVGPVVAASAPLPPPVDAPVGAIALDSAAVSARTLSDGAVLLANQNAYYYLVEDMTFAKTAFVINNTGITLDLNGCEVTYNTSQTMSLWSGGWLTNVHTANFGVYGVLSTDTAYSGQVTSSRACSNFTIKNGTLKAHPGKGQFYATGSAATDTFTAVGHSFANGDQVCLFQMNGGAGLTTYQPYYIINTSGDTFQLSTTVGGSAVDFTTNVTGSRIGTSAGTHAMWCRDELGGIWTIRDMDITAGTGSDSLGVAGEWLSPRIYDSIIRCPCTWTANRQVNPAAVWCRSSSVRVEDSVIIGGNSGIACFTNSTIARNLISHSGYATNGYGVNLYSITGCLVEDNILLPPNGRGIMLDDDAASNTLRNNVILHWENRQVAPVGGDSFASNLQPAAFRIRYRSFSNTITGNSCLGIGGVKSGQSPSEEHTTALGVFISQYTTAIAANTISGNDFRTILYGTPVTKEHTAACIGYHDYYTTSNPGVDVITGNNFYSNDAFVQANGSDGFAIRTGLISSNTFQWQDGEAAYAAFETDVNTKLAAMTMTTAVAAAASARVAEVLLRAASHINDQLLGALQSRRTFWQTDFYTPTNVLNEYCDVIDSTLGVGVDDTTVYRLGPGQATNNQIAYRIGKTHAVQILDNGAPVASATVTVTPDQINTFRDDVTTTTTDGSGNCTITYYENAVTRGHTNAAPSVTAGTSSTIAVAGVGSKSVSHGSLGATIDLTA